MQDVAWFLWLHTLVPVYGSYHLFLCFRWATVRCRMWFGFCGYILLFLSMIVIIYFFVSGGQQSDAGCGLVSVVTYSGSLL